MNKISAVLSIFSTVSLLVSPNAFAEPAPKPAAKADFLKIVDTNGDGKASKEEFFAAMEKKFHSMDVDKSDVVSVQELKLYGEKDEEARKKAQLAAKADKSSAKSLNEDAFTVLFTKRGEKEFASLDKNHDSRLSLDELDAEKKPLKKISKTKAADEKSISKEEFIAMFSESAERNFFKLDKNYDSELSMEELGIVEPVQKIVASAPTSTAGKTEQPLDKKAEQQKMIKSFFVGIDANNDGQISTKEKLAAFERLFNRLDTNHNQFITFDEIIAGRQKPMVVDQ